MVLITAAATAERLGIKTATLAKWRRQGRGPTGWFHFSPTLVVYPEEEVERFITACQQQRPMLRLAAPPPDRA